MFRIELLKRSLKSMLTLEPVRLEDIYVLLHAYFFPIDLQCNAIRQYPNLLHAYLFSPLTYNVTQRVDILPYRVCNESDIGCVNVKLTL